MSELHQLSLFDDGASPVHHAAERDVLRAHQGQPFAGATYEPAKDQRRLTGQALRVWESLTAAPGQWWTLAALRLHLLGRYCAHDTEAAISARLRDLRKPSHGAHVVERRRRTGGLFEYRLIPRSPITGALQWP